MKEEIETKHFEHTFAVSGDEPRCREPLLTKTGRGLCAFHHNLVSHGFYRCDECYVSIFVFLLLMVPKRLEMFV